MDKVQMALKQVKSDIKLKENLTFLLSVPSREEFKPVFEEADKICRKYYGNKVYIRGIIEFSNYCIKNCKYCGIRRENKKLKRYRLTPQEIIDAVLYMKKGGIMTTVLQSGEDPGYDKTLLQIIPKIKNEGVAVTISIGERQEKVYRQFKKAGADRFLMRIETTDPVLFSALHPDDNLNFRKKCLKNIKKMGFETGTGIMVGLPGQSMESIADDLLYFRRLKPAMIGIGPFLAHEDTPLKDFKNTDIFPTLKVVSLLRILLPKINIPATTAMGTIDKHGRQEALKVGANVIMPNFTPSDYRKMYKLYDDKICITENYGLCIGCTEAIAKAANKEVKKGVLGVSKAW
ncbi:MAG: [FeFe] hydrogenase H-cluster radical SAM maturase HydE [Spirochaetia bacterium]|nr:[FeFe] hydrogenase H-cluster radical SAM maturase HydE [Spirochaetia bacterium]